MDDFEKKFSVKSLRTYDAKVVLIRFAFVIMQSFFPAMTKIVGTLGPKSRSVEVISGCLKVGMSGTVLCLYLILNLFLH